MTDHESETSEEKANESDRGKGSKPILSDRASLHKRPAYSFLPSKYVGQARVLGVGQLLPILKV